MPFTTLSNMGLKVPTRATVNWDTTVLQTFTDIDAHDHTSGKGVQIPTGGIADNAVTADKILLTNDNGLKQKDSGGTGRVLINLNTSDTLELLDSGGNEILTGAATASAVNYLDITNAAAGNSPTLAAAGDDSNIDLTLSGKGTGTTVFGGTILMPDELQHVGDTDNKIGFTADTQTFTTGGSTRLDINDSGVQLGGANARVTTVLDEDTMSSDSATSLVTQQSVKAYVDAEVAVANRVTNLGITYSGGTFTITGADGTSLSSSNPAYVRLQSKANPGQSINHTITADQNFIDDAGSSEIIGNLFGATTGVAWGEDCPFYIYAVVNDDAATIQFMISRVPNRTTAPATGEIGAPDDAVADNQYSFFSLDNIDETAYDGNPCLMIGSFRMQMSTSDDWTVQTLSNSDGIGKFHESTIFTMPAGQMGAASGKYFRDNGGTAWAITTTNYQYNIDPFLGKCFYGIRFDNISNAGSGAVSVQPVVPFIPTSTTEIGAGWWTQAGAYRTAVCELSTSASYVDSIYLEGAGTVPLRYANGSINDDLHLSGNFNIAVS